MKKKSFLFLVLGILFASYGISWAISSEPVYLPNPEEFLRTEFSKLGFSGLTVSKDGSGKDVFNVSAAGFSAESAGYKNIIKDIRTTVQKSKAITFKAQLQYVAGNKNPFILVGAQDMKNAGLQILTSSSNFFKFQ